VKKNVTSKQAEQELGIFKESLAHLPDMVLIAEVYSPSPPGPRIIFANEAVVKQTGHSLQEIVGESPRMFQGPNTDRAALGRIRNALENSQPIYEELINYTKEGREYWLGLNLIPIVDSAGKSRHYFSIGRDLSKSKQDEETRRELQQRLLQSQKMESIGILAGGVAHDFNNILTGILGSAQLAKMSFSSTHPAYNDLETIVQATQRAASLTKGLLAYAASGNGALEVVNLNEMVTNILVILRSQMSKSIIVRKALMPDVPAIEADPVQMQQVMMNLCLNASEAMADQGGILSITTDKVVLQEAQSQQSMCSPPAPGVYAVFEVADTGCGMDNEVQKHIFEPFYTSKAQSRGLGLAAALGIVKNHRGGIEVVSEPGQGSTFRVFLPASTRTAARGFIKEEELSHGAQTVLFVDDEEMLRSLCRRSLEHLGYHVILAADGIEAVRIYRERSQQIDLVILDLSMPRQSGEDAYQEMRNIKPDMKVLLCCGYDETMVNRKIAGENLVGFLPKPFGLEVLAQAVHAALR